MKSKELILIWKADQERGENVPIGKLSYGDDLYRFRYLAGMRRAQSLGFRGLIEFPDLSKEYSSPELFPVFSNRVISKKRKDFEAYVQSLGMRLRLSPLFYMEVLGRSGGRRATDRFRVFLPPEKFADGNRERFSIYCFIAGLSQPQFLSAFEKNTKRIHEGLELDLVPEPSNSHDPNALAVYLKKTQLGYVPAYYASELSLLPGLPPSCTVKRVNRPAIKWAPDLLLVEILGDWPTEWRPFTGGDYIPFSAMSSTSSVAS